MEKSGFYFTKYPNVVLDSVMPVIGPSAFKILSIIIRKSRGYQKNGDMISLSQFEEQAGLSRNTVLDSITELVDKKIIEKKRKQNSFWYSINESYLEALSKTDSSNSKKQSSDSALSGVYNPNLYPVQNSNTLKKDLKKDEINTTTISFSEEEYLEVCVFWNKLFGDTLDPKNQRIKKQIITAMGKFSVYQLKKAIFNRSNADYYRKRVPHLRNQPESFFGYPKTISNDLQRKPENVFTHAETVDKIFKEGLNMDCDFQKIDDFQEYGEILWVLRNQNNAR